jgi:hypothetical protein
MDLVALAPHLCGVGGVASITPAVILGGAGAQLFVVEDFAQVCRLVL